MRKKSQKLTLNKNYWVVRMMFVALLLALPVTTFFATAGLSAKTITGVVRSAADNEPLIGVTVRLSGASSGTVTDIDGNYSISANPGQTLVFS